MQPRKFVLLFAALLLLVPTAAQAASTSALVEKGNTFFHKGKYEKAVKDYEEASVDAPESPRILFDKGAAYYRMNDYAKAENAWEKAAVKSEDPLLSAKAFFNLGNCSFSEARRQADSNPKKAVSACVQSVKYYEQALDLLKKPENAKAATLKKNTAQNIEMVRLTMKSILDKLHKQQQAAKKKQAQQKQMQKKADALKQLIRQQKELINRDRYYAQDQQAKKKTKDFKSHIAQMAKDQADLEKKTKDAADHLAATSKKAKKPGPAAKAAKHLQQAQMQQKKAAGRMRNDHLVRARKSQQAALSEMKKALSSLEKGAGSTGQAKPNKTGQKQASEAAKKGRKNPAQTEGQHRPNPAEKQEGHRQHKNSVIDQMPNTAQSIIDQEQQHREERRQAAASGGYENVGKDW